jgi:hypothetical protein
MSYCSYNFCFLRVLQFSNFLVKIIYPFQYRVCLLKIRSKTLLSHFNSSHEKEKGYHFGD